MKKIFGPFYPYTPLESYAEEQTKIVLDVSPTGPFFYDEGTGKDYYVIAKELRDQLAKSSIDHAFISLDTENYTIEYLDNKLKLKIARNYSLVGKVLIIQVIGNDGSTAEVQMEVVG